MNQSPEMTLRRMRWWHGLVFFVCMFCLMFVAQIIIGVVGTLGLFGDSPTEITEALFSPLSIIVQVIITCSVLAFFAFKLPRTFNIPASQWLALGTVRPLVFVVSIMGIVGAGFLVDQIVFLAHLFAPDLFKSAGLETFSTVFHNCSPIVFFALTLTVSAGPSIGEELFFRGLVLRSFRADMSAWPAVALSSILFGIMHMDALQGLGAFLIGIYLGFVVLVTGSVWPAVAAHAVNNLLCALFARYDYQDTGQIWSTGHSQWTLLGASAIAITASIALLRLARKDKVSV
ncbi:MAG: CPBP family intramembrane metalloprotease [Proteobacteria bacterium]|nr:CPBP family intramembrane metalloprotease [Pseudomonadota bacterium]